MSMQMLGSAVNWLMSNQSTILLSELSLFQDSPALNPIWMSHTDPKFYNTSHIYIKFKFSCCE